MDLVTYALAKKYTEDTLKGAGALKGQDGDSAYQIAVKNGFVGTEQEWLNSLEGNGVDGISGNKDGSWTIVYTNGTTNSISNEAYNDLLNKIVNLEATKVSTVNGIVPDENGNIIINNQQIGYLADNGNIVLDGVGPGNYEAAYWDWNGPLTEYDTIPIMVTKNNNQTHNFININTMPIDAKKIVLMKNQTNVGTITISEKVHSLSKDDKLYSFLALSDVHVVYETAKEDLERALTYAENNDIAFTCISGDLTDTGNNDQLELYSSIVQSKALTKPVYAVSGNHEGQQGITLYSSIITYTGHPLYYTFEKDGDVFIMLGLIGDSKRRLFDFQELQWLYEVLEKNRNKRCFVFEHVFPEDGCGNAEKIYPYGLLAGKEAIIFESLLAHYHNVIFFHGHSHLKFYLQEKDERANYDNMFNCHSIHIPSLASPRDKPTSPERPYTNVYADSEGYIVDVYKYGIQLKGRNFVDGKFLPVATYWLDTKIKYIEPNTYVDITNTIKTNNSNFTKIQDLNWHYGHINPETGIVDSESTFYAYTDIIKANQKNNIIKYKSISGVLSYHIIYLNNDGSVNNYVKVANHMGDGGFYLVSPNLDFRIIGKTTIENALENVIKANVTVENDSTYEYIPLFFQPGKLDYHTDGKPIEGDYPNYLYTNSIPLIDDYDYFIQTSNDIDYSIKKMYYDNQDVYTAGNYTEIKNIEQNNQASVNTTFSMHHQNSNMRLRIWFKAELYSQDFIQKNIQMYYKKDEYQNYKN